MDQQIRLIERVRRTLPKGSTYAVAKALETSQTDLSRVLKGRHGLGLKSMVRVAEILQIDLRDVIVLCQEDIAKRPADKEFWSRRSPRITASIAAAILAFGLAVISKDAQSKTVYKNSLTSPRYTLCEVR